MRIGEETKDIFDSNIQYSLVWWKLGYFHSPSTEENIVLSLNNSANKFIRKRAPSLQYAAMWWDIEELTSFERLMEDIMTGMLNWKEIKIHVPKWYTREEYTDMLYQFISEKVKSRWYYFESLKYILTWVQLDILNFLSFPMLETTMSIKMFMRHIQIGLMGKILSKLTTLNNVAFIEDSSLNALNKTYEKHLDTLQDISVDDRIKLSIKKILLNQVKYGHGDDPNTIQYDSKMHSIVKQLEFDTSDLPTKSSITNVWRSFIELEKRVFFLSAHITREFLARLTGKRNKKLG